MESNKLLACGAELADPDVAQHLANEAAPMGRRAGSAFHLCRIDRHLVGEQERQDANPQGGQEQVIAAGHLADDDQRRNGRLRRGGEKAGHADNHKRRRMGHQQGPILMEQDSQRASATPADDHRGPKHAPGTAAAYGKTRREDLSQGDRQQHPAADCRLIGHRLLDRTVAEGEHRQDRLVSAEGIIQEKGGKASQKSAECGPEMRWQRQAMEEPGNAVERSRIEACQKNHEEHQQQIRSQLPGVGKSEIGRIEQRLPTRKESKGAVGDDAGNRRRHDHFRFELGRRVKHFRGEQGAGQRGAEDGGDSRPHAGRHENAAVLGGQFQQIA